MGKFIRFFFGAIIGAFLGSIVATLLAPSSGTELRGRIMGNFITLKDEIQEAAVSKRAELEQELADLRHNISVS